MSNTEPIILLDDLRNAPEDIQQSYTQWVMYERELDDHPERYLILSDRHGEPVQIDCAAVYPMIIKKIQRLGLYTVEIEADIRRRFDIINQVKWAKGREARKWNTWLAGGKKQNVLNFRKGDILELFGSYRSIDQVYETIKTDWGFSLTRGKLQDFYYENLPDIQERRVRFQSQEKDFYLSTGTGRIESLSYLFTEVMKLFDQTKQIKYSSEIRGIIEQVRKEVKGDEIRLTIDGKIDITATVQANRTIQDFNQRLPINLFIVSLVAAKKGINPMSLMAQLGNSFYSNYNGFNKMAEEGEEMKLPSHFINSYDWNEIENMHKDKETKATAKLLELKLTKFFKDNEVKYEGNVLEAVRQLEYKLRGEAVPEIVDVEALEVDVIEDKKPEISNKRKLLQELLDKKKKGTENIK